MVVVITGLAYVAAATELIPSPGQLVGNMELNRPKGGG